MPEVALQDSFKRLIGITMAAIKLNPPPVVVGSRLFMDGSIRPVYLDANGKQFILDHGDTPIHGMWLDPSECDRFVGRTGSVKGTSREGRT
jgi:hypothetical protein